MRIACACIALLLLVACAPASQPVAPSAPAPTAPSPQPAQQPSPQGATSGPMVDALRAALQSDEVSVQGLALAG